ncbi:MAG TPA: NAD(P)-dependent oxidoreductase [Solirubrobacteraceae bacterium]|nr:NAD(P)-dependent oxidoreductase [Solirubrobacteraceae bacterium]
MSDERWLITGALGCIGAWACRQLVREGNDVVAYDLGDDTRRLQLVMDSGERSSVRLVSGDITNLEGLAGVVSRERITHIVHLAALLLPIAKADPPRGALVNVVGTVNVFEAGIRGDVQGVAYASSAAAYDRADGVHVAEDADGHPLNHYGVHKLANEGAARVYWHDAGLASVGLRPHVVYGPGRDHGMTAGPTLAIAAAVAGEPYEVPFGGRAQFQYAPDVAGKFIAGARACAADRGAPVRNVGGPSEHVTDVITAIEAAVPEAAGTITFRQDVELPLPEEMAAVDPVTTPLADGVRETVEMMRQAR